MGWNQYQRESLAREVGAELLSFPCRSASDSLVSNLTHLLYLSSDSFSHQFFMALMA